MGKRVYDKAYFYIRRNNRKRLRQLIRKHRYLHRSDEAFLIFNAIWHNPGILRWLLDRGVHPDSRLGKGGNTPLMQAAANGDLPTMQQLKVNSPYPVTAVVLWLNHRRSPRSEFLGVVHRALRWIRALVLMITPNSKKVAASNRTTQRKKMVALDNRCS